jgi:1-deoxy-D-xylulose-5-phosphate synthase
MAAARDIKGEQGSEGGGRSRHDGALSCGLAYEGLNNAGRSDRDIVVVLNDNEMSIAPNVGAMHKYLTSISAIRSTTGSLEDQARGQRPESGRNDRGKWRRA